MSAPVLSCVWCSETFARPEKRRFLRHIVKFHAEEAVSFYLGQKEIGSRNRPGETLIASDTLRSVGAGSSVVAHRGARDAPR